MSDKKLIVGLGNPGSEYEWTRHNLGFLIATHMAHEARLRFKKASGAKGIVAEGLIENEEVVFLLPHSFMNLSGGVVKQVVAAKRIELQNLLILCDDFSLTFGQMRLRSEGSDAGHNGLKSVIDQLGTKEFSRLRLGIGPVPTGRSTVDFVLQDFRMEEKKELPRFVRGAAECVLAWVHEPVNTVMSRFNQKTHSNDHF